MPFVTHYNDDCILLRKKGGIFYQYGKETDLTNLKLKDIEIPKDTYLENKVNISKNTPDFDEMDKIIGVFGNDIYNVLAFQKYVEINDLKNVYFIPLNGFDEKSILSALKLENMISFNDVYNDVKNTILEQNFESPYPRKYDILQLREKTEMNRKEFAQYFGIPYRTLENWETDVNHCPRYLYNLIEYKLKKEGIISI